MENKGIFAVLTIAGALSLASIAPSAVAAPHGGGGMHPGGGMHFGGGGARFGGGGTHGSFGNHHFRGPGFRSGLALGALGFGLGYPYYAYDDPYYYDYGYGDCYAPRRVWWHGGWHWRRAYVC